MPLEKTIVLGTVQLGIDYGIANHLGKPSFENVVAMIERSIAEEIFCFDTAKSYGDSEEILGRVFDKLGICDKVQVNTKLAAIKKGKLNRNQIYAEVKDSLVKLQINKLWSLMSHDFDSLQIILQTGAIEKLKQDGFISFFGVSVYDVEQANFALEQSDIDIIQLPANAWDLKMYEAGIFEKAKKYNKIVMVRSVYLQGLLLLDPLMVKSKNREAYILSMAWNKWLYENNLNAVEASLGFVLHYADMLVIGAESPSQIQSTASKFRTAMITKSQFRQWQNIVKKYDTKKIVDPRQW